MKALLMGNPNVGKSALFSQMTGIAVKTSNYAGTTVSYTQGKWLLPIDSCSNTCTGCVHGAKCQSYNVNNHIHKGNRGYKGNRGHRGHRGNKGHNHHRTMVDLIDVPGAYSLDPTALSEQMAVDMIGEGDVIINVIDSTNLERNLSLTMDLYQYEKPMIIALNMWDETEHLGINIDINKLEKLLGVPIVPTNGRSGQGVNEVGKRLKEAKIPPKLDISKKWLLIGEIVENVQVLTHRHHSLRDRLQELSIHPILGLPIALIVLAGLFVFVIVFGGWLNQLMNKLFTVLWVPLMEKTYHAISQPWLQRILIGELIEGEIVLESSMGLLTTGIFTPIGLVMPYLLFFYLALGFLEDWGYLPRMAVIFDSFFHRMGLHGYSVIPFILSAGCNIPGLLALRNLETRRERFIAGAIACTTIPCIAQSAVIFASVASLGSVYLVLVIATLVTFAIILGVGLDFFVKGNTPTLVAEMPPYRIPGPKMQFKKLSSRLKGFFIEAVPLMLLGIFLVQVLFLTGFLEKLFSLMSPLIVSLWGLPKETASAMLVGIIRKDAAVALLAPLNLDPMQLVTAVVTLVLYFPCVATYTVLAKEVGKKDLALITAIMLCSALVGGMFMNFLGSFMVPATILILELGLCVLALLIARTMKNKRIIND